jgi:hypothetical protein
MKVMTQRLYHRHRALHPETDCRFDAVADGGRVASWPTVDRQTRGVQTVPMFDVRQLQSTSCVTVTTAYRWRALGEEYLEADVGVW